MKQLFLLGLLSGGLAINGFSQNECVAVETDPESLTPGNTWESGYKNRVNLILNASNWNCNNTSRGDQDNGKRYWPLLLAQLAKAGGPSARKALIDKEGSSGVNATIEGTFYKPFSAPGLSFYYFYYYDELPQAQKDKVKNNWSAKNRDYCSRKDGKMDPIYDCAEYNSENFNWMNRIAGHLHAHKFNDNTNIDGTPAKDWFEEYLNNLVRATYSTGRVEWNSHVYSGFCFQAAAQLYEFTDDVETKKKARALMDWIMATTAINYLDAAVVGPESRDKGSGYKAMNGSVWPYYYLYFNPNISESKIKNQIASNAGIWVTGFPPHISYRPLQVITDIADRKFDLPVEIHSAKPFYKLDEDNYADWRGEGDKGRRFEFETIYMGKNYTMASIASYRPAGQNDFIEQGIWRIGVKGSGDGALQIFGNADGHGGYNDASGRSPYEEIGQFRNVMMRLIKGGSFMYVSVPSERNPAYDGNNLFVDMGNDVYVAVISHNSTGKNSPQDWNDTHKKFTWNFDSDELGALIMEVGTKEKHGSFSEFKNAIKNQASINTPDANQIEYTSTLSNTLKMEFVPPTSYTFTMHDCSEKTIDPAGVVPKVWGNGESFDFETWDSYKVIHGPEIIDQKWGSAKMRMEANGKGVEITVDPFTAEVSYGTYEPGCVPTNAEEPELSTQVKVYPNPANQRMFIESSKEGKANVQLINILGEVVLEESIQLNQVQTLDLNQYQNGVYFLKVRSDNQINTFKINIVH